MDTNYSLSDIAAATGDRNEEFGGGWFWIVVLFLFMFGFGGNAFNRDTGALTRAELADGFNFQDINGQLRGITDGLCDGFNDENFYFNLAKNFIEDPDAKPHKVARYFS